MNNCCRSEFEDTLAYRCRVYDLLRRIYLWELPLECFLELIELANIEQSNEYNNCSSQDALCNYLKTLPHENIDEIYREIHIEYTRLFVGPYHLPTPPYESVYRSSTKLMMQNETIDVRSVYQKNGFQVLKISQEPDDHIGIELEFLCIMSKWTLEALLKKDIQRLEELITVQQGFCDKHLLKWVPKFCSDIIDNSNHPFWKNAAVFTKDFIEEEMAELNELMNSLPQVFGEIEELY